MNKLWSVMLVCAMALGSQDAWAKRLGGGFSLGKQSGNVAQQRAITPPAQSTQNVAARPATSAATPAAAAAPKRPWGAMVGGLAAGLGLAWLASALGFGEAFAQFLLFGLLAVVVLAAIGMVMRRRTAGSGADNLAWQGAGGPATQSGNSQFDPATPRSYSPQNVGNDASARPWERSGPAPLDASAPAGAGGSMIGSSLGGRPVWGVPAGFDAEGFLEASKANFVSLQDAWDRSDIPNLRAMMTDGMLEQIRSQLAEREATSGNSANKTDVVMLDAQLLGIEELDDGYMASVEFSGMIREDASSGPNPFREVWNITRPKTGSGGWLVAGVQALQ